MTPGKRNTSNDKFGQVTTEQYIKQQAHRIRDAKQNGEHEKAQRIANDLVVYLGLD